MTSIEKEPTRADKLRQAIRSILTDLPPRYDATRKVLQQIHDITRDEIANTLQPVLNRRIQAMPRNSYHQKKELAHWVNAELNQFGLAIRCPKTGLPTYLECNPGHTREVGRFRLGYVDERHQRRNTFTAIELPELSLTPQTTKLLRRRPHSGPER